MTPRVFFRRQVVTTLVNPSGVIVEMSGNQAKVRQAPAGYLCAHLPRVRAYPVTGEGLTWGDLSFAA